MLGYWENKMRNRMMSNYLVSPFLEEAASLLIVASRLWHPWSIKRKDELYVIAKQLDDRGRHMRDCGIGWACNSDHFGEMPGHLLSSGAFGRYNCEDKNPPAPDPEAAAYAVAMASKILFSLVPIFQKMGEKNYEDSTAIKWLYGKIEEIQESPIFGNKPEISEALLKELAMRAITIECEGLSYIQATVEDSFDGKPKRKKKSRMSEEKMRSLAEELGTTYESIKEVFETEHSSWWKTAKEYAGKAESHKQNILRNLGAGESVKNSLNK